MHAPTLTIETVHGLKETILFSNFTVGPQTTASPDREDRYEEEPSHMRETLRVAEVAVAKR